MFGHDELNMIRTQIYIYTEYFSKNKYRIFLENLIKQAQNLSLHA